MGVALLEARGVRFSNPWAWALAATGLYVASCVLLWNARLDSYTHTQWLIRHLSYAAIALCVLAPGVAGARALRWTPLVWLGEISYGIYLYHLLVLALLSRWGLIAVGALPAPLRALDGVRAGGLGGAGDAQLASGGASAVASRAASASATSVSAGSSQSQSSPAWIAYTASAPIAPAASGARRAIATIPNTNTPSATRPISPSSAAVSK